MRHHVLVMSACAASVLLGLARPAPAQVQRTGGGESQKIMQQYQQLAAERSGLQAQNAQLKKDLDSAKADLEKLTKERDALKVRAAAVPAAEAAVAQLTAAKAAADRNLEESKQRTTELVGRFRETATNLKEAESDRTKLRSELEARNSAFDKCVDANMQLFDINGDILNRYAQVGMFTRVTADEPFTRITRNRLDNLVLESRARAEELRLKRASPP